MVPMPPGQPMRCPCGNAFVAPPGAPSVVCPYCHQPLIVPGVAPLPVAYAAPAVLDTRRKLAAVMISLAMLTLVIGAISKSWLTAREDDETIKIGLNGVEECRDGRCESMDFDDDRGGRDGILAVLSIVGKVALAGTVALFGVLVWVAARLMARKPAAGPAIAGIVLAALAAIGAAMWAYQMKTHLHEGISYGHGVMLYVAGAGLALAGCIVAKLASPTAA